MNTEGDKNKLKSSSEVNRASSSPITTPLNTNAPLQRPTMRVQDGDIILEDADPSTFADAHLSTPGTAMLNPRSPSLQDATPNPSTSNKPLPLPPQYSGSPVPALDLSLIKRRQSSKQQQQASNNITSDNDNTRTHNNNSSNNNNSNVKIRSISNASRFRTPNDANIGSFKLPNIVIDADTPPNDNPKKKTIGGVDDGPPTRTPSTNKKKDSITRSTKNSASGGGGNSKTTITSTAETSWHELTIDNVQEFLARTTSTESNKVVATERMWRWLVDAGPPFDGSPSVGVSSLKQLGGGSRLHGQSGRYSSVSGGGKGGGGGLFAACFGCFSGDSSKS